MRAHWYVISGRFWFTSCCRFHCPFQLEISWENFASAGNRTRAARVAGEHSTTEPPMLTHLFEVLTLCCSGVKVLFIIATCILYWSCAGPLSIVGRNSSVGRALDWRSKGPWFNPGFRHSRNTRRSTPTFWYENSISHSPNELNRNCLMGAAWYSHRFWFENIPWRQRS